MDLLEFLRDRRLLATVVACWILWALCLALSTRQHLAETAERDEAEQAARTAWLEQGARNPHDAGHWGTYVFRSRDPLAILDPGIEPAIGSWIRLETHAQHDADGRPLDTSTEEARWSSVHPTFVLATLVPLLLLILVHDRLCGEREDGRWQLLLASGLNRRRLVAGKIAGASVMGAAVVVPMLATGIAAVLFFGERVDPLRLATWVGASLLHTSLWLLAGLSISAATATRANAMLLCVAVWFFGAIALPRAAVSVAEFLEPSPSAWRFARSVDELQNDRWTIPYKASSTFGDIYSQIEAEWMAREGVEDPEQLTIDPFGFAIEETEEQGQRAYDETYGDLVRTFQRQDDVAKLIGFLSPAANYSRLSSALARADLAAHQRFQIEAEAYRREMMLTLNMAVAHRGREKLPAGGGRMDGTFEGDRSLWETVPPFRPNGLSTSEVLVKNRSLVLGLLVQAVALLVLAYVLVRES
ncbi:MAG: ABC transporter permease subunit [Acidobacteriota bacterium]